MRKIGYSSSFNTSVPVKLDQKREKDQRSGFICAKLKSLSHWGFPRFRIRRAKGERYRIDDGLILSTQTMFVWKSIGPNVASSTFDILSDQMVIWTSFSRLLIRSRTVYPDLTLPHYATAAFSIRNPGLWCRNKRVCCLSTPNVCTASCVCVPLGILEQYNFQLFHWCSRWIWDGRYFLH